MTTKVTCPQCGAEFAIPEHEHTAVCNVVGKDSNLGEIHPQLASGQPGSRLSILEAKLNALEKAGVNVDLVFSVKYKGSKPKYCRFDENGTGFSEMDNSDPFFLSIAQSGTIPNKHLFRRWVMGQMFWLLHVSSNSNLTQVIRDKGISYEWKAIENEFNAQMKMEHSDEENFKIRNRWFNKGIVSEMVTDLVRQIRDLMQNFDRRGYITYYHSLLHNAAEAIGGIGCSIERTSTIAELLGWIRKIRKALKPLSFAKHCLKMSEVFINQYKGVGAYYTMKNMIMFHDCRMFGEDDERLSYKDSLWVLDEHNSHLAGWQMIGVMKKLIQFNNIDIEAKRAEWYKR